MFGTSEVICSVLQNPTTAEDSLTMKCGHLNDELERMCISEDVRFIDLRPRLNERAYYGLDRSRLNLNTAGCRNVWQMLSSEVNVFFFF